MKVKFISAFILFCIKFSISEGQVDFEVDHVSGTPQILIPIWELRTADLVVPVSITHHGQSLKVDEGAGPAGMGWSLQGGGGVYRTVRGLPDDYSAASPDNRKGWLLNSIASTINAFTPTADDNLAICTDEQNDWNFINGLSYATDPEPDLFMFSAPGLNGKFVFGTDGTPKFIGYQDLKIDVAKDGAGFITEFVITTNKGVRYTFNEREVTTRQAEWLYTRNEPPYFKSDYFYYFSPAVFTTSWLLTSIKSAGGAIVEYDFMNGKTSAGAKVYTGIEASVPDDSLYIIRDEVAPKILSSISTDLISVVFEWDHHGLLSVINVSESEFNDSRRFLFKYDRLSDATVTGIENLSQYFLKEIQQENDCIPFPSYTFQYSVGPQIPFSEMNKRDIWGYYNGTAVGNIPKVYFYSSAVGSERFRVEQNTNATPTSTLSGDDREVSVNSNYGALTRISYPTGGWTTFEYEQHKYYDAVALSDIPAGGMRIKEISTYGGETAFGRMHYQSNEHHSITREFEYVQADGKSSGMVTYHPVYAFADGSNIVRTANDCSPETPVILYSRVVEKIRGKGKRIFNFSLKGVYPETSNGDWNASRSKIARNASVGCVGAGNLKNGPYTFPFAPNPDFGFERAQLMSVIHYSDDNLIVKEESFTYSRIPSSGLTVKALKFERVGGAFHYSRYEIPTGMKSVIASETIKVASDNDPSKFFTTVKTYAYNSQHYLLESITETNSDGATLKEKFKYAKDYAITAPTSDEASGAIYRLNTLRHHAALVEQIKTRTLAGTTSLLSSSVTKYKDLGGDRVLPRELLFFPQNTSFTESSTLAVGPLQQFNFDTDYVMRKRLSYDAKGNVIGESDDKKNSQAWVFGYRGTLPVAYIERASPEQIVFENFESTFDQSLIPSTVPIPTAAGWTGQNSLAMTPAINLQKVNIEKGSNSYRLSCWAKGSTAATLTYAIYNGASLVTSRNLEYLSSGANTWQYLEDFIDLTSASNTFTLKVTTSASVAIDDITFIPRSASIRSTTHKPLSGVRDESDDRGFTVRKEYDAMGRPNKIFDRKGNLVEIDEYQFQNEPQKYLLSDFTTSTSACDIKAGDEVTFTAPTNCVSPVAYVWKINGTTVSTSPSFAYTFNVAGDQLVSLTVSHSSLADQTTVHTVLVHPELEYGILASGGTSFHKCDISYEKTFTVPVLGGCGDPGAITYEWYYYTTASGWVQIGGSGSSSSSIVFDISDHTSAQSYSMRCDITAVCTPLLSAQCVSKGKGIGSKSIFIEYINPSTQCP